HSAWPNAAFATRRAAGRSRPPPLRRWPGSAGSAAPPSEAVGRAEGEVAGRAIAILREEPGLAVVGLVQQVLHVRLQLERVGQGVARHQADQREAILLETERGAGSRVHVRR